MPLLILCIWIVGFLLYFYGIWLRYVGIFPVLIAAIFLAYYGITRDIKIRSSGLLQRYSLFIARIIILAGLVGVFNFFGMALVPICLRLIGINLLLRIGSYIRKYADGKLVFQLGYYLSIVFLIIVMAVFRGWIGFWNALAMMRVMQVGVIGFLIFLVGLREAIEDYLRYKFGIFALWTIIFVIVDQVKNFYIALTLNSVLLTGVYFRIMRILRYQPISEDKKASISVRKILAGERITAIKKQFTSAFQKKLYYFVSNMPKLAKKVLELMNILIIVALIYYYISNIAWFADINHLFYRLIIIIFVTNVLLLKRIGYNSIIQNLVVFLVINFAIYISLFSYLNGSINAIVGRAILRNIASATLIFYAHKIPLLARIFSPLEYTYWLVATVVALVVNIILLRNTTLPGELVFFLVLLYVGLEGMILFYAAKYLQKRMI